MTSVPRPCGHAELRDGCGQCHLYRTNAAVRAAWDARALAGLALVQVGRPVTDSPAPRPQQRPEEEPPCPHRGEPTGATVGCRTCSGTIRLPVLACDLHGKCVTGSRAPAANDVTACRWCNDRPRVPAPGSGRVLTIPEPPPIAAPQTSDRVIVTVAIGDDAERCYATSGPAMQRYAAKVGADFVRLTWPGIPEWPMSCKFGLWSALLRWDRVLWADVDTLFTPRTVNVFDLVAPDRLGVYDESPHLKRHPEHAGVHESYGPFCAANRFPAELPPFYFNAGVMHIPRSHAEMFRPPPLLWVANDGPGRHLAEQHLWNARLASGRWPFQLVDARFNCQSWIYRRFGGAPLDAVYHWSGGPDRANRPANMAAMAALNPWP